MMRWLRTILLPTIALVAATVLLVLLVRAGENSREGAQLVPKSVAGYVEGVGALSGKWAGLHLTRDTRGPLLSRHYYNLSVSSRGRIAGTLEDSVGTSVRSYQILGEAGGGRVVLLDRNRLDPTAFGAELYGCPPMESGHLEGVIVGINYAGERFVSPILIQKGDSISVEEYRHYLARDTTWSHCLEILDVAVSRREPKRASGATSTEH